MKVHNEFSFEISLERLINNSADDSIAIGRTHLGVQMCAAVAGKARLPIVEWYILDTADAVENADQSPCQK